MDSLMTNTVAMDMMTAQTMTATVSSRVRPTGNCMTAAVSVMHTDADTVQHAKHQVYDKAYRFVSDLLPNPVAVQLYYLPHLSAID